MKPTAKMIVALSFRKALWTHSAPHRDIVVLRVRFEPVGFKYLLEVKFVLKTKNEGLPREKII